MTPHTKHLRIFLSVVQHGNLAQAAIESHRAHSAVARSIALLEGTFAAQLFERKARGMLITEAGKALARRVGFAMAEMQEARERLSDQYIQQQRPQPRNSALFSLAVHERRLAALLAFANRPHIGAVAQSLGVSQPSISIALRDIESDVGLDLIDRSTPVLRLTPAGKIISNHLRRAMTQLRLARAELSLIAGEPDETVVVGALPFARTYILPVAIGRLHGKYPRLRFRTEEGPIDTLSQQLCWGNIDLIVGALPSHETHPELQRETLFGDHLKIIARADHPLLSQPDLCLDDTLHCDWVLPRQGTPTRQFLSAAFHRSNTPEPSATVESSDLSIIRGLVLESNMITAVSGHLFHHELRTGTLKALPVELPTGQRLVGILRRTDTHTSPGARLLIAEVRKLSNLTGKSIGQTPSIATE